MECTYRIPQRNPVHVDVNSVVLSSRDCCENCQVSSKSNRPIGSTAGHSSHEIIHVSDVRTCRRWWKR